MGSFEAYDEVEAKRDEAAARLAEAKPGSRKALYLAGIVDALSWVLGEEDPMTLLLQVVD